MTNTWNTDNGKLVFNYYFKPLWKITHMNLPKFGVILTFLTIALPFFRAVNTRYNCNVLLCTRYI
jgi:hypothetical protein